MNSLISGQTVYYVNSLNSGQTVQCLEVVQKVFAPSLTIWKMQSRYDHHPKQTA